jgi:uncharacterized protein
MGDLWVQTSGTWINVLTVLLGSGLGLGLQRRLPLAMQQVITQGVALIVILVGLSLALGLPKVQSGRLDGVILGLLGLVVGGVLGEWLQIEARLEAIGDRLKRRFKGDGRFTEGFVTASLLFCIGPMALIGSFNNGLSGDNRLTVLKAVMDGLSAIALASSYGIGVAFSALSILVYQGGLSLAAAALAQSLGDPSHSPAIAAISGVGGLMIVATGFNLLGVTQIRVASFLPSLLLAPLLNQVGRWLG